MGDVGHESDQQTRPCPIIACDMHRTTEVTNKHDRVRSLHAGASFQLFLGGPNFFFLVFNASELLTHIEPRGGGKFTSIFASINYVFASINNIIVFLSVFQIECQKSNLQ